MWLIVGMWHVPVCQHDVFWETLGIFRLFTLNLIIVCVWELDTVSPLAFIALMFTYGCSGLSWSIIFSLTWAVKDISTKVLHVSAQLLTFIWILIGISYRNQPCKSFNAVWCTPMYLTGTHFSGNSSAF